MVDFPLPRLITAGLVVLIQLSYWPKMLNIVKYSSSGPKCDSMGQAETQPWLKLDGSGQHGCERQTKGNLDDLPPKFWKQPWGMLPRHSMIRHRDNMTQITSFTLTSPSHSWCLAANSGVLASKIKPDREAFHSAGFLPYPMEKEGGFFFGKTTHVCCQEWSRVDSSRSVLHSRTLNSLVLWCSLYLWIATFIKIQHISTTPKIDAETVFFETWLRVWASKTM